MKFKEIIDKYEWSDKFEKTLLKLYPGEEKNLEGYIKVFNKIKNLKPKNSKFTIILGEGEFGDETWIDVFGVNEDDNVSYAIEFVEWCEWIGMNIGVDTLLNFDDIEIIIHCLYEMTYFGFEEEIIKEQEEKIIKAGEEIISMTQEEKDKRNIDIIDDFLKKLKE